MLRAVLLLPAVVTLLGPAILLRLFGAAPVASGAGRAGLAVGGTVLVAAGALLVAVTVRLLWRRGRGTLAPWDPTRRLVVAGPYRHVRNPMISGVMAILAGEALLTAQPALIAWWAGFTVANAWYIPRHEEPGLVARFGAEYEEYRRHVPRWIPRRTPWP